MDVALGQQLIELREKIVSNFAAGDWEEIGLLTGCSELINRHPRLLRSLSWGDEDYAGNVLQMLRIIFEEAPSAIPLIVSYIERKITFAPNVFQVPDGYVESDLAAVMMPFAAEFNSVHAAIKRACTPNGLRCLRADDIWEEATIIQDIFNLVFRAQVVIVDFTGKNSNVMYETGIAHTLGKHVIPITQTLTDVPFDMQHHRALKYLPNHEGITKLEIELAKKLKQFSASREA
jgi:AbiJ N-terminal domain 5